MSDDGERKSHSQRHPTHTHTHTHTNTEMPFTASQCNVVLWVLLALVLLVLTGAVFCPYYRQDNHHTGWAINRCCVRSSCQCYRSRSRSRIHTKKKKKKWLMRVIVSAAGSKKLTVPCSIITGNLHAEGQARRMHRLHSQRNSGLGTRKIRCAV